MLSQYDIIGVLGKGSYGKIYKAKRKSDDLVCVLKQITLDGLSAEEQKDTLNESKVMQQADHRHVIKYYDSFIENGTLIIVMEFASGGDLSQKIKAQKDRPFSEETLWNYLIQIAQGLEYLHSQRILHRDIKAQNIFLDSDEKILIGDLGLARIMGSQSQFAYSGVGTPLYMSPEIIQEDPYNDKSDIWALGCLMYELATQRPPFRATNQIALAKKIANEQPQPIPKYYSNEFQFLVFKMLEKDLVKRPDISQVLSYSSVRIRIERMKLKEKEQQLNEFYRTYEAQLRLRYSQMQEESDVKLAEEREAASAQISNLHRANSQLESKCTELAVQFEEKDKQLKNLTRLFEQQLSKFENYIIEKNQETRKLEVLLQKAQEREESLKNQISLFGKELPNSHQSRLTVTTPRDQIESETSNGFPPTLKRDLEEKAISETEGDFRTGSNTIQIYGPVVDGYSSPLIKSNETESKVSEPKLGIQDSEKVFGVFEEEQTSPELPRTKAIHPVPLIVPPSPTTSPSEEVVQSIAEYSTANFKPVNIQTSLTQNSLIDTPSTPRSMINSFSSSSSSPSPSNASQNTPVNTSYNTPRVSQSEQINQVSFSDVTSTPSPSNQSHPLHFQNLYIHYTPSPSPSPSSYSSSSTPSSNSDSPNTPTTNRQFYHLNSTPVVTPSTQTSLTNQHITNPSNSIDNNHLQSYFQNTSPSLTKNEKSTLPPTPPKTKRQHTTKPQTPTKTNNPISTSIPLSPQSGTTPHKPPQHPVIIQSPHQSRSSSYIYVNPQLFGSSFSLHPPMVCIFIWKRIMGSLYAQNKIDSRIQTGNVWDNKGKYPFLSPSGNILLFFRVNLQLRHTPRIHTFRVRFIQEDVFRKLKTPDALELQSDDKHNDSSEETDSSNGWFMFDMQLGTNSEREVTEFVLEFDQPNPIIELLVVRYEKRIMDFITTKSIFTPVKYSSSSSPSPSPSPSPTLIKSSPLPSQESIIQQQQQAEIFQSVSTPTKSLQTRQIENTPQTSSSPLPPDQLGMLLEKIKDYESRKKLNTNTTTQRVSLTNDNNTPYPSEANANNTNNSILSNNNTTILKEKSKEDIEKNHIIELVRRYKLEKKGLLNVAR